jgi:hypothetical protein
VAYTLEVIVIIAIMLQPVHQRFPSHFIGCAFCGQNCSKFTSWRWGPTADSMCCSSSVCCQLHHSPCSPPTQPWLQQFGHSGWFMNSEQLLLLWLLHGCR